MSPGLRGRLDPMIDEVECSTCGGSRLRDDAAAVRLRGRTMDEYGRLPLDQLAAELARWELTERDKQIGGDLIREIRTRVQFLVDVGLEYLSLGAAARRRSPAASRNGFGSPAR